MASDHSPNALRSEASQGEYNIMFAQLEEARREFERERSAWRDQMASDRAAFEQEKRAFTETTASAIAITKERAPEESVPSTACFAVEMPITLVVGGERFTCMPSLFQKIPNTFFSPLVTGATWHGGGRLPDGSFFIDRDPTVFHLIMTFFRTYGTDFDWQAFRESWSPQEEALFKLEADFYQLRDFMLLPPLCGSILSHDQWHQFDFGKSDRTLLFDNSKHVLCAAELRKRLAGHSHLVLLIHLANDYVVGVFTRRSWCMKRGNAKRLFMGSFIFAFKPDASDDSQSMIGADVSYFNQTFLSHEEAHDIERGKYTCGMSLRFGSQIGGNPYVQVSFGGNHQKVNFLINKDLCSVNAAHDNFTRLEIWTVAATTSSHSASSSSSKKKMNKAK